MIEVKEENHPLKGLWLWEPKYSLAEDAFTDDIKDDIERKTGLSAGSLDDWWLFNRPEPSNPILSWEELIKLSLIILSCEATRLFAHSLYIGNPPNVSFETNYGELPQKSVSGAKRVNVDSGDYMEFGATGLALAFLCMQGKDPEPTTASTGDNKFRLSGKDESCVVEGSWLHWCMLACNVLASENTKIVCPALYAPGLKNDNY